MSVANNRLASFDIVATLGPKVDDADLSEMRAKNSYLCIPGIREANIRGLSRAVKTPDLRERR